MMGWTLRCCSTQVYVEDTTSTTMSTHIQWRCSTSCKYHQSPSADKCADVTGSWDLHPFINTPLNPKPNLYVPGIESAVKLTLDTPAFPSSTLLDTSSAADAGMWGWFRDRSWSFVRLYIVRSRRYNNPALWPSEVVGSMRWSAAKHHWLGQKAMETVPLNLEKLNKEERVLLLLKMFSFKCVSASTRAGSPKKWPSSIIWKQKHKL